MRKTFKIGIFFILLVLFFAPNFTSRYLDLQQQKENEKKIQEEWKTYLMGRFDPAAREDFAAVSAEYALGPNKIFLRKEAYDAFLEMRKEAALSGITLNLASATRNFDYQKGIWERKWANYADIGNQTERFEKILEYSAAPGTSRHHWGTDIDINGADPAYFSTPYGEKVYGWLRANAPRFGFCQVYDKKEENRVSGYNEEKWHWSYLPIARDLTSKYQAFVNERDITGFSGDSEVPKLNLIRNYVLSVNPECNP